MVFDLMADTLPTIMTVSGLQPQAPVDIRTQLLADVSATNPEYTANLPGLLIEDISSTDVAAIVLCDTFRIDLINSITPYGANAFLLNQLGQIYGVPLGLATTTSVGVIFSGVPGYVIPVGFLVSDGTYQYSVLDGAIVGSDGESLIATCVATVSGSWAVPSGTVTELVSSVPTGIDLTCNNPLAGVPGVDAEAQQDYRVRVLQAGLAASQGMTRYLKTLVGNIPGVQQRLISARQQTPGGWEIIVGGGDNYQVANAIFQAILDVSTLVGSSMVIDAITNANPAVVTTVLNHGYQDGDTPTANGVLGMYQINSLEMTVTVIDEKNFSCGIDTTLFSTYSSGGVLTPNSRNVYVAISDYPDTYQIIRVQPPLQNVAIVVTWNTTAINYVSGAAVAQLGEPAILDYVNNIAVGQPMNLYELQTVFQVAISSVLSPQLLTRMQFAVSINGVGVSPSAGTGIIAGDPESYFFTSTSLIIIEQG